MDYSFSREENEYLKETRNISFETIILAMSTGGLLDECPHPNAELYPHQRMFFVGVQDYVYRVPYIISEDTIFLKTIYPSRVATKKYLPL